MTDADELTEIYDSTLLAEPHTVTVEASSAAIARLNLDTWEGEQFSHVKDVIKVDFDRYRGEVTIVTCRTVERRDRGSLTLPLGDVAHVFARPQQEASA